MNGKKVQRKKKRVESTKAEKQRHLTQPSIQITVKHTQNANFILTLWGSDFTVITNTD